MSSAESILRCGVEESASIRLTHLLLGEFFFLLLAITNIAAYDP
jgi:hypothetical protein